MNNALLNKNEQKLISPNGRKAYFSAINYMLSGSIVAFLLISFDRWRLFPIPKFLTGFCLAAFFAFNLLSCISSKNFAKKAYSVIDKLQMGNS